MRASQPSNQSLSRRRLSCFLPISAGTRNGQNESGTLAAWAAEDPSINNDPDGDSPSHFFTFWINFGEKLTVWESRYGCSSMGAINTLSCILGAGGQRSRLPTRLTSFQQLEGGQGLRKSAHPAVLSSSWKAFGKIVMTSQKVKNIKN